MYICVFVCVWGGGGVSGVCVCRHAWMCVRARVCGITCRQKDDLVINYDAVNKLYYIIYLTFRNSIDLFINLCVCVDAPTLDEEKSCIYPRL